LYIFPDDCLEQQEKCVQVCLFHFFKQCIIVGLQSTGEASTLEQLDEAGGELTDFVSTAK